MCLAVLTCEQVGLTPLQQLLARYGLTVIQIAADQPLPGSYWGEPEAGLIGHQLFIKGQTPIHSALHEACHYICMDEHRRLTLDTNAGGDYAEENGVCYLQILLADYLPQVGKTRLWQDMDNWGYSFRLGSAQRWFEEDAADAQQWLQTYGMIDKHNQPTWQKRIK